MDDVVVAHDQMWTFGGAERVALRIGEALDSPVYTPYAGETARQVAEELGVDLVAFAQHRYDGFGRWRRAEGFKSLALTMEWQTAPLAEFETIVSAHMFSRHYRTLDHQYLLNYCHSPPRWLNDLLDRRIETLPRPLRYPAKLYMTGMDVVDARSVDRVDALIVNSEIIRERVRRYYRRDATVIYPPIDTEELEPTSTDEDYFLLLGRVVGSKRPKTVVRAFEGLDQQLKIAGGADNEPLLGENTYTEIKRTAGPNVEMLGYVSDERRRELLAGARAVLYVPVREDFGMVPIEALASGTPVIAANEGFPAVAIEDGVTGVVVDPTVDSVRRGIEQIRDDSFDVETLVETADRYSVERFGDRIRTAVERFQADPTAIRLGERPLLPE